MGNQQNIKYQILITKLRGVTKVNKDRVSAFIS